MPSIWQRWKKQRVRTGQACAPYMDTWVDWGYLLWKLWFHCVWHARLHKRTVQIHTCIVSSAPRWLDKCPLKWKKGMKGLLEAGGTLWLEHMTALLCARQKDGRAVCSVLHVCVYEVVSVCSLMHAYVWVRVRMWVGFLYVGACVKDECGLESTRWREFQMTSNVLVTLRPVCDTWQSNNGISLCVKIPLWLVGGILSITLPQVTTGGKKCRRRSFFSSSAEG